MSVWTVNKCPSAVSHLTRVRRIGESGDNSVFRLEQGGG